jgi:hypothetical protein
MSKRVSLASAGVKVSMPGYDVDTANPDQLLLDPAFKFGQIIARGAASDWSTTIIGSGSIVTLRFTKSVALSLPARADARVAVIHGYSPSAGSRAAVQAGSEAYFGGWTMTPGSGDFIEGTLTTTFSASSINIQYDYRSDYDATWPFLKFRYLVFRKDFNT